MRKRFSYGTLMIDLFTGKTIDMILSRKTEDVSNWLKSFTNIEFISRDGSNAYKSAIEESHPNAIQISDRFHLINSLTDYAKKEILLLLPRIIKLTKTFKTLNEEYYKLKEKTSNKTQITEAYKRKLKLIKNVKTEYKKVESIRAVARNLKINKTTATNYIKGFIPLFSKEKSTPLDKFKNDFVKMINENKTIAYMHNYAVKKGLNTKYSNTRSYIRKLEDSFKLENTPKFITNIKTTVIYRKDIVKLLFDRSIRDIWISEEEIQAVKEILKRNIKAKKIIDIVTNFRITLFSKNSTHLEKWIKNTLRENFKKINAFIGGINKDYQAVLNSITYEVSNGKIEGKINKLKNIKRSMYGRASFELLKQKFFLTENQLN